MERQVEQQEDDEEDDGNQDLQPLFRANLELVLAGPLQRVPSRQVQVPGNCSFGLIHVPADVTRNRVDIHIAGELRVLVTHHRWTRRQLNARELAERYIRA